MPLKHQAGLALLTHGATASSAIRIPERHQLASVVFRLKTVSMLFEAMSEPLVCLVKG